MIRALNRLTEPHFTNGGHHICTGDASLDGAILAGWYAANALDSQRETVKRVCDLLRATQELNKVQHGVILSGEHLRITAADLCDILNAIAYATSLVCDEIRTLELLKLKKPRS